MADRVTKPLIPARVMLVGEEKIPQDVLECLPDEHMHLFLREPDPDTWPKEMEHLLWFLPEEERFRYAVIRAVRRYDSLLVPTLETWTSAAWQETMGNRTTTGTEREVIRETLLTHLRSLAEMCLAEHDPAPPVSIGASTD